LKLEAKRGGLKLQNAGALFLALIASAVGREGAAPSSQPTANAITAVELALIALAAGLSDRALIGDEEGLAAAFSAH
jgi:hypothetical protein